MQQHLVVSLISDDKPGIVEKLSSIVADNGGNWEDSRMARFAGKFAGILRVSVADSHSAGLHEALMKLSEQGYKLQIERTDNGDAAERQEIELSLIGNDRPGIVREISRALAARRFNVERLETSYDSMPWSGEPLFTAACTVSVSADADLDGLQEDLDKIADELGIDIEFAEEE
ncbi:amino acid-binding protein [Proteobacteria bacterium 005FR1]|nr:amino acid-binding protein [Proteobacteria bacterium 005FR1]